jgi:hypothetical protein
MTCKSTPPRTWVYNPKHRPVYSLYRYQHPRRKLRRDRWPPLTPPLEGTLHDFASLEGVLPTPCASAQVLHLHRTFTRLKVLLGQGGVAPPRSKRTKAGQTQPRPENRSLPKFIVLVFRRHPRLDRKVGQKPSPFIPAWRSPLPKLSLCARAQDPRFPWAPPSPAVPDSPLVQPQNAGARQTLPTPKTHDLPRIYPTIYTPHLPPTLAPMCPPNGTHGEARPGTPVQAAHDGATMTLVGHGAPSRPHGPTSRARAPAQAPGHLASAYYIILAYSILKKLLP